MQRSTRGNGQEYRSRHNDRDEAALRFTSALLTWKGNGVKDGMFRFGSLALLGGTLILGGASVFHPPTLNPWDPRRSLEEATHAGWIADHWVLAASMILLHFGLFAFDAWVCETRKAYCGDFRRVAFGCAVASLVLWLGIFVFEATGWPVLASALESEVEGGRIALTAVTQAHLGRADVASSHAVETGAAPTGIAKTSLDQSSQAGPRSVVPAAWPFEASGLYPLARALWATSLALGYAAAWLLGVCVLFWSLDLLKVNREMSREERRELIRRLDRERDQEPSRDESRAEGLKENRRTDRAPGWFVGLGVAAGVVTAVVQPAAFASPRLALWLLLPDAGLLAVWLLAAGWIVWRAADMQAKSRP